MLPSVANGIPMRWHCMLLPVTVFVILGFLFQAQFLFQPQAGVTNPDLSAVGQVIGGFTDDANSEDYKQPTFKLGETELFLNAYLNPYVKGVFVIAVGEEGAAVEEGYAQVVKGLPWKLNLKAGQYRLGFGKLNAAHPHIYPFIESPRSLQALLPGEEGFNDAAIQASILLPTPGSWASTVSGDLLRGHAFHPNSSKTELGWLGRWSNAFLVGDAGVLEVGASVAQGTHDPELNTKTLLAGLDSKAEWVFTSQLRLVTQGELIMNSTENIDSLSNKTTTSRLGGYGFANLCFGTQYIGGVFYDQFQAIENDQKTNRAFKAYAGYAVLEESTLLRVSYEVFLPEDEDSIQSLALQLVFSMGPHKPHLF